MFFFHLFIYLGTEVCAATAATAAGGASSPLGLAKYMSSRT